MNYAPPGQVKQPYVIYQQQPVQKPGLLTRICCCCCINTGIAQRFNRWSCCAKLCCLIPCIIIFFGILVVASLLIWTQVGVHGPNTYAINALSSIDGNSTVSWEMYKSSYIVMPKNGTLERGLVLVPEFKVDARAYIPIAKELAGRGYIVGIVSSPLNLPFFAYGRVKDVVDKYSNSKVKFAVGGHGIGANTAAAIADTRYVVNVRGLFLMAPIEGVAYSRTDLEVAYVSGTADGWSSPESLSANKQALPTNTQYVQASGGNHGQFASMEGRFSGDGSPTLSEQEQQAIAIDAAADLLKKL